jgi:3'(2'), 5'-bisphosphate nucleotidase
VLSEEADAIPWSRRSAWDWLWVVDPLDGTREFVQRNGEFTVNIALVHDHRPVIGVVHAPALERDYYACDGVGAFRSDAAAASQAIRVAARGSGPLRVVGSRSHRGSSLDEFLARIGDHELVAVGSSLKFCLVAEGVADIYPRLGPTSEWDTAAGQCVLEQAGGQVLRVDGRPLDYNAREQLLNPHFVACADVGTDWPALLR